MFPGAREDAEDATDACGAVVAMDVVADRGDGGTGALGGGEQGEGLGRGAGGPVRVRDAMPAPWRAQVLAEELSGSGVEQADVGAVPLHVDAAAATVRALSAPRRTGRRPGFGRTVDAGIGPAPLPAVEMRLSDVEPLEAEAAQRRLLGVADGGFDLALAALRE